MKSVVPPRCVVIFLVLFSGLISPRLAPAASGKRVAVHIGGQSGRSHRTHAMQIVNRVRLYRRRHGALASWAYYWLVVANQMSRVPRGRRESWHAVVALLKPGRRPAELGCSGRRMPR